MSAPKKKAAPRRISSPKIAARASEAATDARSIDPSTLDPSHDARTPDTSIAALITHAETVAESVRSLKGPLSRAKVTLADAERLDALAALLRDQEEVWQTARKATATGAVATRRAPLLKGRNDLFGALDAFVDDAGVVEALAEIGGVDDDDDLDTDTARLVKLARQQCAALEGTEITPARVDEVEASLKSFREARKGVVNVRVAGDTKQQLTEAARVALELRNRVFWALSALDRTVCKRGRYCFREQPKRRAAFAAYATEPRRARKATTEPVTPTG